MELYRPDLLFILARSSMLQNFTLMAKPTCGECNLACRYCYYLEKVGLYPNEPIRRMPPDVLEHFIRSYLQSGLPHVHFLWQGGEPTLLGIDFFRRAVELQKKYCPPGVTVSNALQTNGTLIDSEWAAFLRENRFLVGLSLDGPQHLHDPYRIDRQGRGSFSRVNEGFRILREEGVEFNILILVNDLNSRDPRAIYQFLTENGARFLQLIPCLNYGEEKKPVRHSVSPEAFGEVLLTFFRLWQEKHVGQVYVQIIEVTFEQLLTGRSSLCLQAEADCHHYVVEWNGDLYACDHFVYPEWKIGNICQTPLPELVQKPLARELSRRKKNLPSFCRTCPYLQVCWGGCPKHRIVQQKEGEPPLNYFCPAYRAFFQEAVPFLRRLAGLSEAKQKVGRNDPCPCGSGRKYKDCCLRRHSQGLAF